MSPDRPQAPGPSAGPEGAPLRVRDLMSHQTARVRPSDSLRIAALFMRLRDVGFLPVLREGMVVGVITDRDITVRATAAGLDPSTTPVAVAMTPEVFYCFDDEETATAAQVMEEEGVRRLVVFDRKMRLVGVLSLDDLTAVPGGARTAGQTLRHLT
ncbi:MAG: CBS domain-containing protein [Myxococcaceae bacterium]